MQGCLKLYQSSASLLLAIALASSIVCVGQAAAEVGEESSIDATNSPKQDVVSLETSGAETSSSQTRITAKCPPPPAYQLLRYDEDYSYLDDSKCCTDSWDPTTYIP